MFWRWGLWFYLKCGYVCTKLHGVTSRETDVTDMRLADLALRRIFLVYNWVLCKFQKVRTCSEFSSVLRSHYSERDILHFCTKSYCFRLVTSVPLWWLRFNPSPVCVVFVVDKVALGQVFLQVLQFFPYHYYSTYSFIDRLCGLVIRVSGYRYRGLGFDSQRYQIFWVVVGLERGPLSLMRSTEELLE